MIRSTLLQEIFIPASTKLRTDLALTESAVCKGKCTGKCGSQVEPTLELPAHFYTQGINPHPYD